MGDEFLVRHVALHAVAHPTRRHAILGRVLGGVILAVYSTGRLRPAILFGYAGIGYLEGRTLTVSAGLQD